MGRALVTHVLAFQRSSLAGPCHYCCCFKLNHLKQLRRCPRKPHSPSSCILEARKKYVTLIKKKLFGFSSRGGHRWAVSMVSRCRWAESGWFCAVSMCSAIRDRRRLVPKGRRGQWVDQCYGPLFVSTSDHSVSRFICTRCRRFESGPTFWSTTCAA
jgi:hypothetical protein